MMVNNILADLPALANDFLKSHQNANNIVDIIDKFKRAYEQQRSTVPFLRTLETVLIEVLKRGDMSGDDTVNNSARNKYIEWLRTVYEETWKIILSIMHRESTEEAKQALFSCMKLLATEGKYPISKFNTNQDHYFPVERLRNVMKQLVFSERSQTNLIQSFCEYAKYIDVVFFAWQLFPEFINSQDFADPTQAINFLDLIDALPVTVEIEKRELLLCPCREHNGNANFDYAVTRRSINQLWCSLMACKGFMLPAVHKRMLFVLLERMMPHLDKPMLLTDFLMDSLQCGGVLSLLAFQGVFTLIQKHNVTCPHIYEKLYSMFDLDMLHTNYKARLFYLSDIYLSSTHLPECLVGGFIKRLARLSLNASPQLIIIIMSFISNLLARHPGLQNLLCEENRSEMLQDPFLKEELNPMKSNSLDSSLWELLLLKNHVLPSVAISALSLTNKKGVTDLDLHAVLRLNEQNIYKEVDLSADTEWTLGLERPYSLYLPNQDKVKQHWKLL